MGLPTFLAEFPVLSREFGEGEEEMIEVLVLCVDEADRLITEGLGPGDPAITQAKNHYTIITSLLVVSFTV